MKGCSAVIITFNPNNKHLEEMLTLLKKQVEYIFIVDNTPTMKECSYQKENIHFIHLGDNYGIAKAQNIGLRKSTELGCRKCLLLDQDSIVPIDLVDALYKDMDFLQNAGHRVACIGPRIDDVLENKLEQSNDEGAAISNCYPTRQIIASGSLFDLCSLKEIGEMESDLFIDAVDHEWCWRALSKGYEIFVSANIKMEHVIGVGRGRFLFWKYIVCSPIRHYYQFRNTLLLLPRSYVPIKWKIKKIIEMIFMPFIYLISGPDRLKRLNYMRLGMFDGLRGRAGKIS